MILIYMIILILIIYGVSIFIKYAGMEKPEYSLKYFRDEEYIKYPVLVIGFLDRKKVEEKHFVATVLDFVSRGYIKVEKNLNDYEFTVIKQIKEATDIEKRALKIFFNNYVAVGEKQSLNQFKEIMKNEKKFGYYRNIQKIFNKEIRENLDKKQEVKQITKDANRKNIFICYFVFLVIYCILKIMQIGNIRIIQECLIATIIFAIFMIPIKIIKLTLLGEISWGKAIFVSAIVVQIMIYVGIFAEIPKVYIILLVFAISGVIIIFDDMLQRKKTNIANTYEMVKGLKRYIKDYSSIDEYGMEQIYLWDKYYVYAVALNIKKY